ncbi:DNA repair-scaffolding protein-like [Candoia aspera]|uniref:DNA repair-scaffolding protein-like n=1 Tax=Candoia aspera TaxID=51853 RepID=UPI002FD813F1
MAMRKRKRACYIEHASFPDEMPREEEKKNLHAPVAAASASDACWLHCGDGFQTASSLEAKGSLGKPVRAKKTFASLLNSAEGISTTENLCEFTEIVWSSSGSEFSDDENNIAASDYPCMKMKKYRKYGLISKEACNKEEPQFIEWENDSDYEDDEQCSGSEGNDVPLDILDTDSCTNSTFKPDREKEDEPSKITMLKCNLNMFSYSVPKL